MDVRALPRAAVDRSLRLARLPVDAATRLLPEDQPVRLAVDRADATLRGLAGRVLGDRSLQEEAQDRRVAAAERERALRLRAEAELRADRADTEFEQRQTQAEERREQAAATAEEREQRAEEQRDAEVRRITETEEQKKKAVRKTAAKVEESIESRAKRTRLAELEQEAVALEEHDKALETKSEAQRLARAAARAKQERKSS
jgi:colicin import membrane protein